MRNYTYVYILQSEVDQDRHYTGHTTDLQERLKKHNSGGCPHTAKYRPWHIRCAIAFSDEGRATAFEQYLKTHSGRVFASRHL